MSSFGLRVHNPSQELCVASDSITPAYLGKATFVSTTQPGTSLISSLSGFSTYTFTYAGSFLVPIVPLPTCAGAGVTGCSAIIASCTNVGSAWTITVHNSTGSLNTVGFDVEVAPSAVYCFGQPVSSSGFGLNIYDASANLVADLRLRQITIVKRASLAAAATQFTMPAVTTPGVIGVPTDTSTSNVVVGPNWRNRYSHRGWRWDTTGGFLQRALYQYDLELEGASAGTTNAINAIDALIVELNGLP